MKKENMQREIDRLKARAIALESQLIHQYHFADAEIKRLNTDRYLGSCVIIHMTNQAGKSLVGPVAIRDGLGDDTIAALRSDFRRSYELGTLFRPEGMSDNTQTEKSNETD